MESVDECVSWLNRPVMDLIQLRSVVTRLATNWEQLKLLLRERGLVVREDSASPSPPRRDGEMELVDKDTTGSSQTTSQQSSQPGSEEQATQQPPAGSQSPSDGDGTTTTVARAFIGPVKMTNDVEVSGDHGDRGQSAVQYENHGEVAIMAESGQTESMQHQNACMETSESATIHSSGLQMS